MVLRILVSTSKYKHPLSFLVRAYTYNDRPTFCPESLGNRLARQEGTSNPDTRPCTMIFDTNTSSQHPREPPRCIPDSNRIWFLRSATLLLEFPFLFVSYFRSLHCYPTPNFFCPFFSPIKKETANKTATDNFSTLRSPVLDVFRRSTRPPSMDLVKVDRTIREQRTHTGAVTLVDSSRTIHVQPNFSLSMLDTMEVQIARLFSFEASFFFLNIKIIILNFWKIQDWARSIQLPKD